jgi:NADPH-dependent 2,4-dienoyl-CoA reductase/sulfur reductase-like enzyme/rhodanese-related sulfurtransferase
MPVNRIVVVGGVAGGASAAAKARRTDEHALITLFERGPYISFANCGLPYYVGGEITDRDDLLLQTPDSFKARFNVDARLNHEVTAINRERKTVSVKNLKTGESFEQPYDKLVISPGAKAAVPKIPGVEAKNIFTLKTVPDADALKAFIAEHKPKQAVVVGAGFIGLETAESLVKLGIDTTVVELMDQVLPPLDADMAVYVSNHLRNAGLKLVLGDGIKSFNGGDIANEVELSSGKKIPAGVILLSVGVIPRTSLAAAAGIRLGETGGIAVDEFMRTGDPDIYAAGDAVECTQLVTGKKGRIMLAGPANKQGRVAGENAAGGNRRFKGALGTSIVESMGITAGRTGLCERDAKKENIDYVVALLHPGNHAGYYPGAQTLHLKVLAERSTGKIIGAQAVGIDGVDKRLDVFATAITAGMTSADVAALDLAYAPQFGSAKDPVIVAGMILDNQLSGNSSGITPSALEAARKAGVELKILDVRTPGEYKSGAVAGAENIPVDELRSRLGSLDKDKSTIVYCKVGLRGYVAERILRQNGFKDVRNLSGGVMSLDMPEQKAPARAITTVSVDDAARAKTAGDGVFIDVREKEEYAYERIEGIQNCPLSTLDTSCGDLPRNGVVYIFCQSGVRSRQAAQSLGARGIADVRVVEGGLNAWRGKGLAVIKSNGPLPIMRQVQITVGILILLAVFSVKYFWVAGLFGAGLTFAGISGWCGMAKLLELMPWNKAAKAACAAGTVRPAGTGKGCCG